MLIETLILVGLLFLALLYPLWFWMKAVWFSHSKTMAEERAGLDKAIELGMAVEQMNEYMRNVSKSDNGDNRGYA